MDDFPHHYTTTADSGPDGPVTLSSSGLDPLETAPPREFGGPGDRWSPETLLVGAVADCFVLSFRAIARASKLDWRALRCAATGRLERQDRTTRFTRVELEAVLVIPRAADGEPPTETTVARARRLLEKAEATCLVSRSLACEVVLEGRVEMAP